MSGIETDYFDQKNYKTKPIPLNGVMYKKHKATCSNLLEIYEYVSKDGTRKKVLIQKMRDAQSYSTFIRIFKQSNQAKFHDVKFSPIQQCQNSVYVHAANISTMCINQFIYYIKIEKKKPVTKVSLMQYNLDTETTLEISKDSI